MAAATYTFIYPAGRVSCDWPGCCSGAWVCADGWTWHVPAVMERAEGRFSVRPVGTGIFVRCVPANGIHEYWLNDQYQVPIQKMGWRDPRASVLDGEVAAGRRPLGKDI